MNAHSRSGPTPQKTTEFFRSIYSLPPYAIAYEAGRQLREWWPDRVLLECAGCAFDLDGYVDAGHATARYRDDLVYNEIATSWQGCDESVTQMGCWIRDGEVNRRAVNAVVSVDWNGKSLEVVCLSWRESVRENRYYFLMGSDQDTVHAFFRAVAQWTNTPHGEVLVFSRGTWRKDPTLFESIQATRADELVLPPGFKEQIFEDIAQFFARREVYARHGIPWKRGILLLGPPGNGKTHAVKAICLAAGKPVLYVRSLESSGMFSSGEHAHVSMVFELARTTAPCLLVLEDLDAMITQGNRSVFLNELDGFAQNTGLCVIATTNYPERLDPSILDRPSRFDRKYTFDLPNHAGRRAYLERWCHQQSEELRLSETALESVAETTEGFSFAYLKELCLATSMAWINAGPGASLEAIARAQATALQAQRRSAPAEAPPAPPRPSDAEQFMALLDKMT